MLAFGEKATFDAVNGVVVGAVLSTVTDLLVKAPAIARAIDIAQRGGVDAIWHEGIAGVFAVPHLTLTALPAPVNVRTMTLALFLTVNVQFTAAASVMVELKAVVSLMPMLASGEKMSFVAVKCSCHGLRLVDGVGSAEVNPVRGKALPARSVIAAAVLTSNRKVPSPAARSRR